MFRPSGECVLIDFGLSHHNLLPDLLQEEFRLPYGTAPYMAPERLLGVRDDPRSDLFSLGVLLYFFTTGERPFGESETLRGMRRRLWRDPYPPRKLRPDYPPWLQEIVLRCLEIEPVWRHPTPGFATGVRTGPSRTGQADRALGAAAARSALYGVAPPFQSRPDAAEAEIRFAAQLASGPIVVVALDTEEGRGRSTNACAGLPHSCSPHCRRRGSPALNVLRLGRITIDRTLDEQGNNKHIDRMVALRHWAQPLELDRKPAHCACAGGGRSRRRDPGIHQGQSCRSHRDRRAAELDAARATRQRVSQGRGRGRMHGDRRAAAAVGFWRRFTKGARASAGSGVECAHSRDWTGGRLFFSAAGSARDSFVTRPSLGRAGGIGCGGGARRLPPSRRARCLATPACGAATIASLPVPHDRDIEGPAVLADEGAGNCPDRARARRRRPPRPVRRRPRAARTRRRARAPGAMWRWRRRP